ncbi:aldehyde dehydrogenase family protein [Aliarcobacter skirrowii]|nr:aldehyde dehydrogenase family protein [Aliarcobacter skirrowii]
MPRSNEKDVDLAVEAAKKGFEEFKHTSVLRAESGTIWVNCYHVYPAHASFGGYKKSGIGRETHMMMLNNYRHTKNILTSFNTKALGFF